MTAKARSRRPNGAAGKATTRKTRGLDARSRNNLQGVHPDLKRVIERAARSADFIVTDGVRSRERQRELFKAGKSKTMNSRHLNGHAIDFVAREGKTGVSYAMADMTRIAKVIKRAALAEGVPIEWGASAKYGGDFGKFNDSPHIQLPWRYYPDSGLNLGQKAMSAASTREGAAISAGTAVAAVIKVAEHVDLDDGLPAIFDVIPDMSWVPTLTAAGDQLAALLAWASANPGIAAIFAAFFAWVWLEDPLRAAGNWLRAKLPIKGELG